MVVTGSVATPVIGLAGGPGDLDSGQALLSCPIHHPKINELMEAMPEWITEFGLTPYRIDARVGELKGIIAFYSPLSAQLYVRFVVRSVDRLDGLRRLVPALQTKFPEAVCISANIQPVPHALLEGPEEIFLTERKWIEHRLGSHSLQLAPQAFVQTNAEVATQLYETASRWIGLARPARVLELFSGQGAFSFFAAHAAPSLRGIEINEEAVRVANATALELGLSHLSFVAADATRVGAEIAAFAPDLILANPPRRGLGQGGVEQLLTARPRHFIYSSCAVETLASDLAALGGAYQIKKAQLFDMFPHTEHFETLVWLERK
jgi:23S rRNA (uracil747-C5)-methyltransferase